MKFHLIAGFILLLRPLAASAAVPPMPSPVQAKTDMESKIVNEVGGILDRFLGPGRAHVTVFLNVAVKSAADDASNARKPEDRKAKKIEAKWVWREISKKPKMSVLPGFSVNPDVTVSDNKEKRPATKPEDKPSDGDSTDIPAYEIEIRRMLVSIVLDKSISEKNEKMIEVMISEVLGLDPDRGDRLNIYKLPLQPAWKWALQTPETLLRIFWGGIGLFALALLLYFVTRSIQAVNQARPRLSARPEDKVEKDETIRSSGAESAAAGAGTEAAAAASAAKTSEDAVIHPRLDFVNLDNFEMLSELLKDSDPKDIACLMGFVDPVLSSRILDQFSHGKRLEVMMYLVCATSIPPQELAEVRRAWRERLSFAYGGTGAVGELLSTMDPGMQTMFLERLKNVSPDLVAKVADALVRMEDLARLEGPDLAHLAQSVPFDSWAKALAPMAQPYKDRVLASLPDSSRQVLQQWLSLTKANKIEVAEAQLKVLATMRTMIRQGRIALAKEPTPAPRPSAPKPGPAMPAAPAVLMNAADSNRK